MRLAPLRIRFAVKDLNPHPLRIQQKYLDIRFVPNSGAEQKWSRYPIFFNKKQICVSLKNNSDFIFSKQKLSLPLQNFTMNFIFILSWWEVCVLLNDLKSKVYTGWRKNLLVGTPMPGTLNGRGQTKSSSSNSDIDYIFVICDNHVV